ncbi:hypothetical protein, partial [Pyramidobacter porci]
MAVFGRRAAVFSETGAVAAASSFFWLPGRLPARISPAAEFFVVGGAGFDSHILVFFLLEFLTLRFGDLISVAARRFHLPD